MVELDWFSELSSHSVNQTSSECRCVVKYSESTSLRSIVCGSTEIHKKENWKNLIEILPLSSCNWVLKSLVYEIDFWTWFFFYFELDFTGYTGSKNQVWNRQKIKLKNRVKKSILWNRDF